MKRHKHFKLSGRSDIDFPHSHKSHRKHRSTSSQHIFSKCVILCLLTCVFASDGGWGSVEECAHVHACRGQWRTLGVPAALTFHLWHWSGSLTESGAGHKASKAPCCYRFYLHAGPCLQASTHHVLIPTRELVAWIQAYKLLKQLLLPAEPSLWPLLCGLGIKIFLS